LVWFGFETGLTSNWDSAGITIVHHHSTRGLRFLIMTFYISKVAFSKYNQYTIQKIWKSVHIFQIAFFYICKFLSFHSPNLTKKVHEIAVSYVMFLQKDWTITLSYKVANEFVF
jgi:hypothetical protein